MSDPQLPARLLDDLRAIVGAPHVITEPRDQAPYTDEQRGRFESRTPAVVRPGSTGEVAAVVAACGDGRVGVVPQGGNTGLVGGAVAAGEIVVNLGRMNKVREIDAANFTMTVDAGLVLADAQKAATQAGRHFPLSLAAEGSCQIGGN
ncbi:MAG: FAD-binding oxidoreductase, partial [Alphaproteobacteria bacterium]|nr:FAD-binding oxidoreductase [Alphaproteobacteria bacterium]